MRIDVRRMFIGLLVLAALFAFVTSAAGRSAGRQEQQSTHWIGTWTASVQPDSMTTLTNQTFATLSTAPRAVKE
jgi:hypothetical protein